MSFVVVGGWWLVAGGWWLVAGGWWLVAGGWWLVVAAAAAAAASREHAKPDSHPPRAPSPNSPHSHALLHLVIDNRASKR